jgi:hypothetical protein
VCLLPVGVVPVRAQGAALRLAGKVGLDPAMMAAPAAVS